MRLYIFSSQLRESGMWRIYHVLQILRIPDSAKASYVSSTSQDILDQVKVEFGPAFMKRLEFEKIFVSVALISN